MPTTRASRPPVLGKLRPPRLGRVFDRQRLFDQLDAAASAPGLWLAGAPGIGKTTLVATYLQARGLPCLWLQLDAGDADPASFVHFLAAAADAALPARRQLTLPQPGADDLRDLPAFVRRCFRRLALALDLPWVLVLDNLQEIGAASPLHAGIAAALAELPGRARLVAISREPPPDAYARMLAGQQLVLVDEQALHFSEQDTAQLLDLHGSSWAAPALRQATDGWAAAMVLLLATRSEFGPQQSLRSGQARERLFGFFAAEVLDKLAPDDAAALQRIACLPSASAAMAVAISGQAGAGALLAELTRRSLFTERRDGQPPSYTFHALFGEFLRARAVQTLSPEALLALRLAAASLLASHGQVDAAVDLLVEAAAWPQALNLVLAQAPTLLAQGRGQRLLGWLLALPEAQRDQPAAWYWLGHAALALDPAGALGHLERAHRGFAALGDADGAFTSACAAADAIVFLGIGLRALQAWLPLLGERAGTYLQQRDAQTDLRVLPGLLAAFVYCQPGHALTAPLADLAERLLEQSAGAAQRILLGTLAYYLLWTGQMARLDRMLVKVDRLCAASDAAPATLLRWYGVGMLVRALLGRSDEALQQGRLALALAQRGAPALQARAHTSMVLAAISARDPVLAHQHHALAALALDPHNAVDAATHGYNRGVLAFLDGDWPQALVLMRASVASGRASGWPLREHIALLAHALAATQAGAHTEAEQALELALAHPFHAMCRWHQWLGGLVHAHLALSQAQLPRALQALDQALTTARECGYDFGLLVFCCGDTMPRLMATALAHGVQPDLAAAIVRRHALAAPVGAGATWPWPVRVQTLGRLLISRDGAPLPAARKESRKPLDLLKLLLALGGQGVPVARLCAALWPEAEGDAARNSFDNALHRLRKLLGDDAHLLLQGGGLSLNPATCWNDLAALDALLAQVEALPAGGRAPADPALTLDLAEQALALVAGDFLDGDESLPELQQARARVQSRFARLVAVLGQRLMARQQAAAAARLYQRAVEQQPLAEALYRRLMACHLALGQPAEAYAVYRRCRQQLSVLLGLAPAAETEAVLAEVRAAGFLDR